MTGRSVWFDGAWVDVSGGTTPTPEVLTAAAYDALDPPDPATTYVVKDQGRQSARRVYLGETLIDVLPFHDPFSRTDSSSTLGAPWTAHGGTFGVSGNRGRLVTVGDNAAELASVDVGSADMWCEWVMGVHVNGGGYFAVRVVDSANAIFAANSSVNVNTWSIYRRESGSNTNLATGTSTGWATAGNVIRLECEGTTIRLYSNNSLVGTATGVTAHQSATRAGFGGFRLDSASVDARNARVASFRCGPL